MRNRRRFVVAMGFFLGLSTGVVSASAHAKARPRPPDDEAAAKGVDPTPSGNKLHLAPVAGPRTIDLGDDLVLNLPEGFLYLDAPQAQQFMESLGNSHQDALRAVVVKPDADWLVTFTFTPDGYVKDDEAEKMDADAILDAIREGTEEENKFRLQQGFKALHVLGWSEPPRYSREAHHVVWGVRAKDEAGEVINFNTRVLGRKGYASLNLIDDPTRLEDSKKEAATLLQATTFKPGARYEDFDKKSDKVASYGLAALIVGGAGAAALKLVKIGLLAKFGGKLLVLLLALKKGLVLVLVAVGAWFRRLFGRKKASNLAPQSPQQTAAAWHPEPPPPELNAEPASPSEKAPGESGPGGQHDT